MHAYGLFCHAHCTLHRGRGLFSAQPGFAEVILAQFEFVASLHPVSWQCFVSATATQPQCQTSLFVRARSHTEKPALADETIQMLMVLKWSI